MYVGADQASRLAERLEMRDEIFTFQTKVEMTAQEKAAAEGDIEMLSSLIEADAHVLPPSPPSEKFHFNSPQRQLSSSSLEPQDDLAALGLRLAALNRDLAAAEQRTDGRNATIRALKKQITTVSEQMAAFDQIVGLSTTRLEGPLST